MAVKPHPVFTMMKSDDSVARAMRWTVFLKENKFDFSGIAEIRMDSDFPVMLDPAGNKFSIDFAGNKKNYAKKKAGMKTELLSKAMGAGRYGKRILDLSAGLGIDAVFLAQLGYSVTAVERNPLIFLALQEAVAAVELDLKFEFGEAHDFANLETDVIYFDPMFPEKQKSALPRQEMVFFKAMVGSDNDADAVLQKAVASRSAKRVVVKRPLKAPLLGNLKPQSAVAGKLVRFDIYGVKA